MAWPDAPANFGSRGQYAGGNWPGKKYGAFGSTMFPSMGRPGIGNLGFSVHVNLKSLIYLVDKETMKFRGTAFNKALARANAEAADLIKWGMAEELDRQIAAHSPKRQRRAGERLKNSILHENNHEIYANQFTVGRPSWLDRSPAAEYWRSIEEGMGTWSGPILFTNDFSRFHGPWSPGGGRNKKAPEGYPHQRLVSTDGGVWADRIGPYPAYHFSRGGKNAARKIKWRDLYRRHLEPAGFNVSDGVFKSRGRVAIGP